MLRVVDLPEGYHSLISLDDDFAVFSTIHRFHSSDQFLSPQSCHAALWGWCSLLVRGVEFASDMVAKKRTFFHLFWESTTCILAMFPAQLCGVYSYSGPKESYTSLRCRALHLLHLWTFCCLFDLCPPWPICEFWWAALIDLIVLPDIIKISDMFFTTPDLDFSTTLSLTWRAPLASRLVELQTLGPFRTGVHILRSRNT